jgi:NDP-hexose-3-ketoreductase
MNLLLIGYSDIAQRRVLPALMRNERISGIDVASRSRLSLASGAFGKLRGLFSNYDDALRLSDADVVYISTTNETHESLIEQTLHSGRHVIVDKPALIGDAVADKTERLIQLAQSRELCLSEATVFAFHPQIAQMNALLRQAKTLNPMAKCEIMATFTFPPFKADNFRLDPLRGGGVIWDLAAYAVTPGRLFLNELPTDATCKIVSQDTNALPETFDLTLIYPSGRMVGRYGFGTEYVNRIEIRHAETALAADRIFTTPPDYINAINLRQGMTLTTYSVPPADSFECFFDDVLGAIGAGDGQGYERFAHMMHMDAQAVQLLTQSART